VAYHVLCRYPRHIRVRIYCIDQVCWREGLTTKWVSGSGSVGGPLQIEEKFGGLGPQRLSSCTQPATNKPGVVKSCGLTVSSVEHDVLWEAFPRSRRQ
jgi:hypothetical protein